MSQPDARELFARHHRTILAFLRRSTGSAAEAEDLTQEVFVRVLRGLETYEARERDLAWLFKIARRLALDARRTAERRPRLVGVETDVAPGARGTQDLRVALDEALAGLPSGEREAFLLREQGGLSYDEIAGVMDATPDAVRNRLCRARAALRRALRPSLSALQARMAEEARR